MGARGYRQVETNINGLSGVFVFWDFMDADVDTQTNISRTFCSMCQKHVDVQQKIPECCFQELLFIALPLFNDWNQRVLHHSVFLMNAFVHCVNAPATLPHAHYEYCVFGSSPLIRHLSPFTVCLSQTSL